MFISEFLRADNKGHENFEFVDVNLDSDTPVFIDPCLIEKDNTSWCADASKKIDSFFDGMYTEFRHGDIRKSGLFNHAGEQNATKLGYGNGFNGKGKTAEGLADSLSGLKLLAKDIPTISCIQDMSVFVEGVAEDCTSDLITNILHGHLNDFTADQMEKYGCRPQGEKNIWTFDHVNKEWIQEVRPCWEYNGSEILLVPKRIVRKNYLFHPHQYLYSVIIERIRRENGWDDLTKHDIWDNLSKTGEHWEYSKVRSYSREYPDAVTEYHEKIPYYYGKKNGTMSDQDLDSVVYSRK